MEVHQIEKKAEGHTCGTPAKLGILSKISYVLFGVFISSLLMALSVKLISNTFGVILGLAAAIAISYYGLKTIKKSSPIRLIIWGIIGTTSAIILGTIFFVITVQMMPNNIEGF